MSGEVWVSLGRASNATLHNPDQILSAVKNHLRLLSGVWKDDMLFEKMKPGGNLEDNWKQVGLCHQTYFSAPQSEKQAVFMQMMQVGPYQE